MINKLVIFLSAALAVACLCTARFYSMRAGPGKEEGGLAAAFAILAVVCLVFTIVVAVINWRAKRTICPECGKRVDKESIQSLCGKTACIKCRLVIAAQTESPRWTF